MWRKKCALNLKRHQPVIDKIYLYAKDPHEIKHQFLVNKHKDVGLNHYNDSKAYIEYQNNMDGIYENIE